MIALNKKNIRVALIALSVIIITFVGGRFTGKEKRISSSSSSQASNTPHQATIWTCSMHPQIKMPKPGKCPLCGMNLIPLESDTDESGGEREVSISAYSAKLMQLETTIVQHRAVSAEVRMVGHVDYDETRVSYISAWFPGRIDKLFVDYTGIPVKKGDPLAELYSPELLTAQEELIQAIQTLKKLKNSDSTYLLQTARKTIDAAREKLRLWGFTAQQISEIEKRGTPAERMTIYSPGLGIVIHKNAQEGMYLKTGSRIYTIADLSKVWVQLDAYESDLAALRYGGKVAFTTETYPGETFVGTIAFIDPIINPTTRTAKVRVETDNQKLKLKPGMFVRATAYSQSNPENPPLVIPVSAALKTGKRAIVYVQLPNQKKPTYEGREILLGQRLGNFYVVKRGLKAGDRVVSHGAFKLDAELQIQAKPSMMTPDGGGGGGMAGMDMGGDDDKEKMSDDEMKKMDRPSVRLPMATRMQLEAVFKAGQTALNALSTKQKKTKPLFKNLEHALSKVDATAFPTTLHSLWKEANMLLGNDAAEGLEMVSQADAEALATQLNDHLKSLKKKFGLGGKPMKSAVLEAPKAFKQQLEAAVQAYFQIHQALATDDPSAGKNAAEAMQKKLKSVQMELLKGDAHMIWMKQLEGLNKALDQIVKTTDIKRQREAFYPLSKQLAETLKTFPPNQPIKQAFCPMAFNNAGAIWLQQSDKILNPYFGTAMSTCGEIEKTIGAKK